MRLDIRRTGSVKLRDEIIGNNVRVKVVKNKVAPPFREVEFDIMYGQGISKLGEIIDLGVKAGVVEKSGSWFSYNSQRIGQGRDNAREFLKANPDIAAEIEAAVRKNAGIIVEELLVGPRRKMMSRGPDSVPVRFQRPDRGADVTPATTVRAYPRDLASGARSSKTGRLSMGAAEGPNRITPSVSSGPIQNRRDRFQDVERDLSEKSGPLFESRALKCEAGFERKSASAFSLPLRRCFPLAIAAGLAKGGRDLIFGLPVVTIS